MSCSAKNYSALDYFNIKSAEGYYDSDDSVSCKFYASI